MDSSVLMSHARLSVNMETNRHINILTTKPSRHSFQKVLENKVIALVMREVHFSGLVAIAASFQ